LSTGNYKFLVDGLLIVISQH